MPLKKRQKNILTALKELGGEASTREIAEKVSLNVNGVSQSLGALGKYVVGLGGRGGEMRWKLVSE
ncbi:MAG: winged helix-turn-helix transcriptional regulator [Patescibacteria group bacterium]|nr:winged helix-turn-helix transcriptional regulator [bacterium]MDZ4241156.1 winged helix-turn-helix transcriptional regulator [Patescibacteria group bacterium]